MTEAGHLGEKLVLQEGRWERTEQAALLCWWQPSPSRQWEDDAFANSFKTDQQPSNPKV